MRISVFLKMTQFQTNTPLFINTLKEKDFSAARKQIKESSVKKFSQKDKTQTTNYFYSIALAPNKMSVKKRGQ